MNTKSFIEKNKWLLMAFFSFGLLAMVVSSHHSAPQALETPSVDSVDTMIPKGYILVPLELENIEQIGSLIGNSGVVDLYTGGAETKQRRLVASRVKVIQAPFNPQVYAALIPEGEGSVIQNYLGPFRAVVQNPKQSGSSVHREVKNNFSIVYQR